MRISTAVLFWTMFYIMPRCVFLCQFRCVIAIPCGFIHESLFVVDVEYAFHHLPFLVRGGVSIALLELCYVCLPVFLPWQSGETCHCLIPVEVFWRVNYHDEACSYDVYLHLHDAHFAHASKHFGTEMRFVVSLAIATYKFGVVSQFHGLAVTFSTLAKVFLYVSLCHGLLEVLANLSCYALKLLLCEREFLVCEYHILLRLHRYEVYMSVWHF